MTRARHRSDALACEVELTYVGTRDFHEGTRWGALGDLGELFVHKEHFDVYVCPRCGRVELFVDGVARSSPGDRAARRSRRAMGDATLRP